jgi:SAM-dependent methyltransferase
LREEFRQALQLQERPMNVLLTALRAMGLLTVEGQCVLLTDLARAHLVPDAPHDVSGYIGLAADSPGVLELAQRLQANQPAQGEAGAAFMYREGMESAMDKEASARALTLGLAGRAKNVAPVLAQVVDLREARLLLDVAGGSGLYSIAFLQRFPNLQAVVWDRPEVLKVAEEFGHEYGVSDRLELLPGDMFADPVPTDADVTLLSNVLHDWDVPECRTLLGKCVKSLAPGGRLLIHDAYLNDALDGPLPVALYSVALFSLTQGRAYSAAEYRQWLGELGMEAGPVVPTLIHCGVLSAVRK